MPRASKNHSPSKRQRVHQEPNRASPPESFFEEDIHLNHGDPV